jgi:hypothetical protein
MRPTRAVAAVIMLAALAAQGTTLASGAARKPVKCKSHQVRVRVGKKKFMCRPFKSVFPAPRAIDLRVAHLQEALKSDPYKRGKKGKRRPRRVANAEKKAVRKFLKVLPKAVALADRLTKEAKPRAVASAFCSTPEATPTGQTGGVKVTGTYGKEGDDGGVMEYSPGDTVRLTYSSCRHGGFSIPDCPTASGIVQSKRGSRSLNVTNEVRKGDRVLFRQSTAFEDRFDARGKVGADGKLKSIDVHITQDVLIVASGGIVRRGHSERHVEVAMPSGLYFVDGADATLTGDTGALQDGTSFSSLVDGTISAYREAEKGWTSFDHEPYCAEPTFDPASNTKRLKKGDTGPLKMYAKAREDGGKATEARWSTENPQNAQFSPPTSNAADATVNYTVSSSPQGNQVKVTVKVTSTAGVGKKEWIQDLNDVNHIGGTFQGADDDGSGRLDFNGNIMYVRDDPGDMGGSNGTFVFQSGSYTVDASGTGPHGCQQQGHQGFLLAAGGMSVFGNGPDYGAPYMYSWFAPNPMDTSMNVSLSGCPMGQEAYNGTVESIDAGVPIGDHGGATSADGISFVDSYVNGNVTESWSFTASP